MFQTAYLCTKTGTTARKEMWRKTGVCNKYACHPSSCGNDGWNLISSGHMGCIHNARCKRLCVSAVRIVIESFKTDVNAKCEEGHRFFYVCSSPHWKTSQGQKCSMAKSQSSRNIIKILVTLTFPWISVCLPVYLLIHPSMHQTVLYHMDRYVTRVVLTNHFLCYWYYRCFLTSESCLVSLPAVTKRSLTF